MKNKTSFIIFLVFTLAACGGRGRGLKSDAEVIPDTPIQNNKGIAYHVTGGLTHSTPVKESEVVFPETGDFYFQSATSTQKIKLFDSETNKKENFDLDGITFIPAPKEIKLMETPNQKNINENNIKHIGTFTVQDLSNSYRFKVNQNQVGSVSLVKHETRIEYTKEGSSIILHTENIEPLISPLVIEYHSEDNFLTMMIKVDPNESEKIFVKNEGSDPSPSIPDHSFCSRFFFTPAGTGIPGIGQAADQQVACDTDAGTCLISTLMEPGGKMVPLKTMDHLPPAQCVSWKIPPPLIHSISYSLRLSIPTIQKALQLIPAIASASANSELLFQKIVLDEKFLELKF